jgi:predicted RNA binding protein YcfA (HicA-like mRNA interferase family)
MRNIRTFRTYWNLLEPFGTLFPLLEQKGSKVQYFWHTQRERVIVIKKESKIKKEKKRGTINRAFQNFLFKRKFFNATCLVAIPATRLGRLV